MRQKVIFRVDGSPKIGLGHLIRCIALAQMLDRHFEISFVCKEIPDKINLEIKSLGYSLIIIVSEEAFFRGLSKTDLVVLDHYFLDSDYQKSIKNSGCKLVCIDDLHDREFFADLIINHAPEMLASDYKAQTYTQFALGLNYVLLRPAFIERAKEERDQKPLESVFVCFGGADNKNITQVVINILRSDSRFKRVVVVTGIAYDNPEKLMASVANDNRFMFFHAVDSIKMCDLIASCQLAIVPASGILQEVISLGCKVISGIYIDNQKDIFEKYKMLQGFESAEDFSATNIEDAINRVFKGGILSNRNFIDGQSDRRLLDVFKQLFTEDEIMLRDACKGDLLKTFEWATDKSIRAFSFNKNDIEFEEHSAWFLEKIGSKSCYYFIAEKSNIVIGSIRFDIQYDSATISYLLDPSFHNKGLGICLLKKGVDMLIGKNDNRIKNVVGMVMSQNVASFKTFERLGYINTEENGNFKFLKRII